MPMILHDLKSGKCRVEPDLDDAESRAIGRFVGQWAFLEHVIFWHSRAIADAVKIALPQDSANASFQRRLKAWRLLVEECAPDGERERLLKVLSKIANLEQDRHRVAHGLWDWDFDEPDRVTASSFRPPYEFQKSFDALKIEELANQVGELSFAIQYPGGMREVMEGWADEAGQVAYVGTSREHARQLKASKSRKK